MLHPHACSNDLKTVQTALRSFPMLGHLVGDQDIKTHHVFLDAKTISMQTNRDKQNKAKKKQQQQEQQRFCSLQCQLLNV